MGTLIGAVALWSALGGAILVAAMCNSRGPLGTVIGIEFMNPFWVYKHYRLNYFGVVMVTLGYNLISPLMSLAYWFYKLCTIGRK